MNLQDPCHRPKKGNSIVRIWGKAGNKATKERTCTQNQEGGESEADRGLAREGRQASAKEKNSEVLPKSVVLTLFRFKSLLFF